MAEDKLYSFCGVSYCDWNGPFPVDHDPGTMSLNEIAVDLTCEPETFLPAGPPEDEDDLPYHDDAPLPGRFVFPGQETPKPSGKEVVPIYHVHSGMLRMARAMGDTGRPVHAAVKEALFHNPDYGGWNSHFQTQLSQIP